MHASGDRRVAAQRLRAAAQDRRVAGLEAQRRGVGGHVRPRFVDDADHAERHAHAADLDAGGPVAQVGDLADRIGQRRDLREARRPSRAIVAGVSVSRSTNAASWPVARAAPTSSAFAAMSRPSARRIAAAIAGSARFLASVSARATSRAAARAASPTPRMYAATSARPGTLRFVIGIILTCGRNRRELDNPVPIRTQLVASATTTSLADRKATPCRRLPHVNAPPRPPRATRGRASHA